ncbi:MAG: nucleotide pyrophosphohydrolase [Candidatus Xenobium sp.]|jgi:NTP pyrophosphatase (non-canonical NTP hydrolase)|nr:nucleotide pyrophosphohydrolase [Burkholderiales bacterium]
MRSDSRWTVAALREEVLAFRDARDWAQFHQPKDLALALSIEAAEVLELFRFKSDAEVRAQVEKRDVTDLGHELADVLYWVLLLSHETGIDLAQAMEEKLAFNARRYPVELSRGRKEKYTILHGYQEAAEPTGESLPEEDPDEPDPPVLKPTLMPGGPRRKVAPLLRRSGDCAEDSGSGLESAGAPASPA